MSVQIPAATDSEFALLGALMAHAEWWDEVGFDLQESDFFAHGNKQVFLALQSLNNNGKPVDMILVYEEMKRLELADGITMADVGRIAQADWSSKTNIRRHAERVKDAATARALLLASGEIQALAVDESLTVPQRVDKANLELEKVTRPDVGQEPKMVSEYAANMIDRLEAMASGEIEPGLKTRIPKLDDMLNGGLRRGNQVIIAARPSVGKSSFAQQLCLTAALNGETAAFFSMEMSNQELTDRSVANLGRAPLSGIATGKFEGDGWARVTEGVEQLRNLPFLVFEKAALTLSEITARARMLKRKHNLRILAIDYLQLCASSSNTQSRHHQIEEISRGLKSLAKQLDITILTLSQLNRGVENRSSPEPQPSDLKESGAIEEDADVILMLWTDSEQDGHRVVGCKVPKNRQGQTGKLALHFEGSYQRWTESACELQAGKKAAPSGKYKEEF